MFALFVVHASAQTEQKGQTQDERDSLRNHALMSPPFTMEVGREAMLDGNGTIEFWIDPTWVKIQGDAVVLSCEAGGIPLYTVFFREDFRGNLSVGIDYGQGQPHLFPVSEIDPSDAYWYHIALVTENGVTRLFKDGTQPSQKRARIEHGAAISRVPGDAAPQITIGAANPSVREGINANIAGLRVWKSTLPQDRISDIAHFHGMQDEPVENSFRYKPDLPLRDLILYSDFQEGRRQLKAFDPIMGFWVEHQASNRKIETPNKAVLLAPQFQIELYRTFYITELSGHLIMFKDGNYFGRVTRESRERYSVQPRFGSPFQLEFKEAGHLRGAEKRRWRQRLVCEGLPKVYDLPDLSPGDQLVLARFTDSELDSLKSENKIQLSGIAADDYNFDKTIKHAQIIQKSFDVTRMNPFNLAAEGRGVRRNKNGRVFANATDVKDENLVKVVDVGADLFWIGRKYTDSRTQIFSSAEEVKTAMSMSAGMSVNVPATASVGFNASLKQELSDMEKTDK
ncbi:MAG: LamG-like jellyroll fold domain-containing protein, partial [Verrucomicrobiota bacterium]